MSLNFNCTSCQFQFSEELQYKQHYRSDFHRYNVKRKLISLPPLSQSDYTVQFQCDSSAKSSTQKQLYCELCSKKFLSIQTYKQHVGSQKHKSNRKKLIQNSKCHDDKSDSSSCSQFSIIGDKKKNQCIFCSVAYSKQHMKTVHNFPPFANQCLDIEALTQFVKSQIAQGKCLICDQTFQCQQSAKQHMIDVGHSQLNINNFQKYEKYYLWKIQQQSSSQQEGQIVQDVEFDQQDFENLNKETLESLQQKRLNRIQRTNIGFLINGKEVGTRELRKYYKQYLGRQIPQNPFRKSNSALSLTQDWKNIHKSQNILCRFQNNAHIVGFR